MTISAAMRSDIESAARLHNLPPEFIAAVVLTESDGDINAWRVEPRYRYLWNIETGQPFRTLTQAEIASEHAPADFPHPKYCSRDTEWWGQSASWGPMQVMGAVAREHDFQQGFPALCSISYGILVGCLHLAHLRNRFLTAHGWEGVAAAYNAGSPRKGDDGKWVNQSYVDAIRRNRGFAFNAEDFT